jgi:hypothetical protein
MPRLPARFAGVILCLAPLFFQRSWRHAEVLLIGVILAPGQRTVAGMFRITGLLLRNRTIKVRAEQRRKIAAQRVAGAAENAWENTGWSTYWGFGESP